MSAPHAADCGRNGAFCPTGEHGNCTGCAGEVPAAAPLPEHDLGCPVAHCPGCHPSGGHRIACPCAYDDHIVPAVFIEADHVNALAEHRARAAAELDQGRRHQRGDGGKPNTRTETAITLREGDQVVDRDDVVHTVIQYDSLPENCVTFITDRGVRIHHRWEDARRATYDVITGGGS